jgi:hypothetical protein
VKEQVLSAGDRAALQGLIGLAGTLGVGALLARLIPVRKKAPDRHLGFVVFEVSSVVAILTSAGMTAYSAVLFLHQDQPLSDGDLTRVGAPLVVSLTLLVLLVALGRFASLPGGLTLYLPNLMTSVVLGCTLGLSVAFLDLSPIEIVAVAAGLLAIGRCFAWLHAVMERLDLGSRQRGARHRATDRMTQGYRPKAMTLQAGLPIVLGEPASPTIPCWIKEGKTFLDQDGAQRLASEVTRRWTEFAGGNAIAPNGGTILVDFRVGSSIFPESLRPVMMISLHRRPAVKPAVHKIRADGGVFPITGLGLID